MATRIARPIEEAGKATRKKADDSHLMRWGFMASYPINLAHETGSKYLGTWPNDKVPAKQLLMIPGAENTGPFEFPAQIFNDADSAPLDPQGSWFASMPITQYGDGHKGQKQGPTTLFTKSPKMVAYILMRRCDKDGMCLFEKMAGASEEEMSEIFDLVLPPLVLQRTTRRILEVDIKGPFLDEIRTHLMATKGRIVVPESWAKLPEEMRELKESQLRHVFSEVYAACERAWHVENKHLNETEEQIRLFRSGKRGKAGYGMPDEQFATLNDPHLPMDLVCLADTNRPPLDMQDFAAQERLNQGTNNAMLEGMKTWGDAMVARMEQAQQTGVDAAQVNALIQQAIAQRDAVWEERMKQMAEIEKLKYEQRPAA